MRQLLRRSSLMAVVVGVCAVGPELSAQAPVDPRFEALAALAESKMKEFGVPGVAFGIVNAGGVTIRGLGVTNVEDPLPVGWRTRLSLVLLLLIVLKPLATAFTVGSGGGGGVFGASLYQGALYGGVGPGLLAVACSAAAVYLFALPYYSLAIASPQTRIRLGVFLVETVFISIVCGALRSAQRRLEASRAELEAEAAERQRLLGETEAGRRAAEALAHVGALTTQSLDPRDVRQRMVDSVRGLFEAQRAALYTLDPESGDLVVQAVSGASPAALASLRTFSPGMGLVALAVQDRRPMITADVLNDPRVQLTAENRAQIEQAGLPAVLVVPLLTRDTVVGALTVSDRIGRGFTDDDTRLAQTFAAQTAITLEHAQLYERAGQKVLWALVAGTGVTGA